MKSKLDKIQPAVKKETKRIARMVVIGVILMWIVFAVLHGFYPGKVPFDYTVILAGAIGGAVAVLNFFWMAVTVQTVVACEEDETAGKKMKASYMQRIQIQMLWVALAIILPCFQFAAGIFPIFIPSLGIKITGIANR